MALVGRSGAGKTSLVNLLVRFQEVSSNALLKTLEEPGDRIVIILLADHYLKLPATLFAIKQ